MPWRPSGCAAAACWPQDCSASGVQAAWTFAQALYLFSPLLVSVAVSALVQRYDLLPWVHPTLGLVTASFVLALVIHPLIAEVGFLIGARKTAR